MENVKKGCYGYSDDGYQDHIYCMEKSWTWARLTKKEQDAIYSLLEASRPRMTMQEHDYEREWDLASDIYSACLKLLHYAPIGWRDPKPTVKDLSLKEIIDETEKCLNQLKFYKQHHSY